MRGKNGTFLWSQSPSGFRVDSAQKEPLEETNTKGPDAWACHPGNANATPLRPLRLERRRRRLRLLSQCALRKRQMAVDVKIQINQIQVNFFQGHVKEQNKQLNSPKILQALKTMPQNGTLVNGNND